MSLDATKLVLNIDETVYDSITITFGKQNVKTHKMSIPWSANVFKAFF